MKSGQTHVVFKEPAKLRAWLANNLGCNAFFNGDALARSLCARFSSTLYPARVDPAHAVAGDGYTYDGCYGMYPVTPRPELCSLAWAVGPASGGLTAAVPLRPTPNANPRRSLPRTSCSPQPKSAPSRSPSPLHLHPRPCYRRLCIWEAGALRQRVPPAQQED